MATVWKTFWIRFLECTFKPRASIEDKYREADRKGGAVEVPSSSHHLFESDVIEHVPNWKLNEPRAESERWGGDGDTSPLSSPELLPLALLSDEISLCLSRTMLGSISLQSCRRTPLGSQATTTLPQASLIRCCETASSILVPVAWGGFTHVSIGSRLMVSLVSLALHIGIWLPLWNIVSKNGLHSNFIGMGMEYTTRFPPKRNI